MKIDQAPHAAETEVYLQELHDALTHVRDLPIRRSHPIGRHPSPGAPLSTTDLQRRLLETIEQLRPAGHVSADATRSRRYRYLTLRYV